MKFNGITKVGQEYLAKQLAANKPVEFTKIKFGDGKLDDYDNPAELTKLQNLKVEKTILRKEQKGETATLTTYLDNVKLETGYYPREIGVYINDSGQEKLYYYINDGDETSWVPPEKDGPFKIEVKINLIVSNSESVIVHNDGKDLYLTKNDMDLQVKETTASIEKKMKDFDKAILGKFDGAFPLSSAAEGKVYYCQPNEKFYKCVKAYSGSQLTSPNANFTEINVFDNR
ncbi:MULTISPECIES: phage tail protein, partial [unclassified Fusobacterium]